MSKLSGHGSRIKRKERYHHMFAAEFKGLFYKTLSENTFKNKIINIITSEDDSKIWAISDDLYHHFGLKIADITTCIS